MVQLSARGRFSPLYPVVLYRERNFWAFAAEKFNTFPLLQRIIFYFTFSYL
jgi:hypothetical protein